MNKKDCLIVDDEPDIRELIEITLSRMSISSDSASNIEEAHQYLKNSCYKLCLTDMRLPDGDGIELIEYIGKKLPELPVAMITAHGNMDSAIRALKAGAFDFVSKPVDINVLRNLVETALKLSVVQPPSSTTQVEAKKTGSFKQAELIGSSKEIESIRLLTQKLARNQAPVHISGESGTGKEVAAR